MTIVRRTKHLSLLAAVLVSSAPVFGADWKQADGPLKTRWAKDVTPDNALPEYPRPQLVRKDWQSLNGLWEFGAAKEGEQPPTGRTLGEQILVPYPEESALSGIMRHEDRAWYRRTFEVPKAWAGRNVLLHFDAVNFAATVYLNGQKLGEHKGGYDAFGYNITKGLKSDGPQELILEVVDTPDAGNHARGKQTMRPGGIFYTPASGIWQTVWIEPVPTTFIENVKAVPNVDGGSVAVTVQTLGSTGGKKPTVKVDVMTGGRPVASGSGPSGKAIKIKLPDARLWSPDEPFLYDLSVRVEDNATVEGAGAGAAALGNAAADSIQSYFGMRKIALGKDDKGILRPMLNNKFVFQVGPLDQGFWPDGIYTAPTDAALKYDIEITKKLGFNATRKHVKVEPERWYYWCDKLGLLVWQDMPSMRDVPGGDGQNRLDRLKKKGASAEEIAKLQAGIDRNAPQVAHRAAAEKEQFEHELDRLIQGPRSNHPSIVQWVVFNEGWGQYDTERLTQHVKDLDPSRLVDNASGWTDMKVGDVIDMHHYPDPAMPKPEETRASELGEFGGLGLAIPKHTWSEKSWSYRGAAGPDGLTAAYERMLAKAWKLKDDGLCAVIYTQITDVETEMNGLLTYDREVVKPDLARLASVNAGHTENIPQPHVIVPTAEQDKAIAWRYSTEEPDGDGWTKPGFDDSKWQQGPGGFGTAQTPGAIIGTEWKTNNIWIRREFTMPEGGLKDPQLLMHHDDDAEVYLNGVLADKQTGYVSEYQPFPISSEAKATLKPGKNTIAIHCNQHAGGQFIDAGIVDVK